MVNRALVQILCFLCAFLMCNVAGAASLKRAVSINVCTDQLLLLLGEPEQIVSLSHFSHEPAMSVLYEKAQQYPMNYGRAELVYLSKPDLVLAGTFSTPATVHMLRNLGLRVELFSPARNFDDIKENLARAGELLGQEDRAKYYIKQLDDALSQAKSEKSNKTVALYFANNYTSGSNTLFHSVIEAAGLINIGDLLGFKGATRLPLELFILQMPDFLLSNSSYSKPALAFEALSHPAMLQIAKRGRHISIPENLTACGTPFTALAISALRDAVNAH